jgi:NYN domain
MGTTEIGVLLIDWENLSGALIDRGKEIHRSYVDDLWAYSNTKCGGHLQHSHVAAAKLDPTIEAAMGVHLIEHEKVRSTKEQADILLTVLAMDYLHDGMGQFILVTGDQDFIPLIRRLHRDGRNVTVIYGDPTRLSAELRRTLATTPGLESLDIAEVTTLRERKRDAGCRSLLGLLELQRRGYVLGGKENGERTALLLGWGVIENQDESQYWSLITAMTEKVVRTDVPRMVDGKWLPQNATRTYLSLNAERLADIAAIDFAVRQLTSRLPRGLTTGGLRTGPFQTDNGAMLDRVLDALSAAGIIRKGADGAYSMADQGMQLGYLEQLWRVYAGLSAECYQRQVGSIPFRKLEGLLGVKGVGQGQDQRAAGRISAAIKYASSAGVIDVVAVDGFRHVAPKFSPLCRQLEMGYHELYRGFSTQIGQEMPVAEVMGFMESRDSSRSVPLFGFDNRDHHRMLRILSQSHLLNWHGDKVVFKRSDWGEAGAALAS